jgi:uncharacterized RDD family membrane protein YckC
MKHEASTAWHQGEGAADEQREVTVEARDMRYAGFWLRFVANVVDAFVAVPLMMLHWPGFLSREAALVAAIPLLVAGALYSVVMHARWGQTLGKMAAGIKVVTVAGDAIAWREALLRDSVAIGFGIISTAATMVALLHIPESSFSHDAGQQSLLLQAAQPAWGRAAGIAGGVWFWSELLVLLFNRQRRALHDFIAGTVVIRTR